MTDSPPSILCIGALYTGSERGLASDILASRARGLAPVTVCTALVVASHGAVTDLTEVPVDTVFSQLEHIDRTIQPSAVRIGILGSDRNADVILKWASGATVPVVLELVASGPSGETVLPARGIDVVAEHLAVADLVLISRQDAELVTGGEIGSLDDAQVAAQRITNRGAQRVVIDCGHLPARFYDAADDPGGDSSVSALSSYLYFDGEDFALFETPVLQPAHQQSLFAITVADELSQSSSPEAAIQAAVREIVEASRELVNTKAEGGLLNYHWRHRDETRLP